MKVADDIDMKDGIVRLLTPEGWEKKYYAASTVEIVMDGEWGEATTKIRCKTEKGGRDLMEVLKRDMAYPAITVRRMGNLHFSGGQVQHED